MRLNSPQNFAWIPVGVFHKGLIKMMQCLVLDKLNLNSNSKFNLMSKVVHVTVYQNQIIDVSGISCHWILDVFQEPVIRIYRYSWVGFEPSWLLLCLLVNELNHQPMRTGTSNTMFYKSVSFGAKLISLLNTTLFSTEKQSSHSKPCFPVKSH